VKGRVRARLAGRNRPGSPTQHTHHSPHTHTSANTSVKEPPRSMANLKARAGGGPAAPESAAAAVSAILFCVCVRRRARARTRRADGRVRCGRVHPPAKVEREGGPGRGLLSRASPPSMHRRRRTRKFPSALLLATTTTARLVFRPHRSAPNKKKRRPKCGWAPAPPGRVPPVACLATRTPAWPACCAARPGPCWRAGGPRMRGRRPWQRVRFFFGKSRGGGALASPCAGLWTCV
jgi:hypothetical protein